METPCNYTYIPSLAFKSIKLQRQLSSSYYVPVLGKSSCWKFLKESNVIYISI